MRQNRDGDSATGLSNEEMLDLYTTQMRRFVKEKFWRNKCIYIIDIVIRAIAIKKGGKNCQITPYDIIDSLSFEGIHKLHNSLDYLGDSMDSTKLGKYIDTLQGDISNFNWMASVLIGITKKLFPQITEKVEILGAIGENSLELEKASTKIKNYKI